MRAGFSEARDWMSNGLELDHTMCDLRAVAGEPGNVNVVELELHNHVRARKLVANARASQISAVTPG